MSPVMDDELVADKAIYVQYNPIKRLHAFSCFKNFMLLIYPIRNRPILVFNVTNTKTNDNITVIMMHTHGNRSIDTIAGNDV